MNITMSTPIKNQFVGILVAAARARELKQQGHRARAGVQGPTVQAAEEVRLGKIGEDYLNLFKSR